MPVLARAFSKIDETLGTAGKDLITLKIRLQSQPWHLYSGVVTRCVSRPPPCPKARRGAAGAWRRWPSIATSSSSENTPEARNMDATPRQIIARLEGYSGVSSPSLPAIAQTSTGEAKWHCNTRARTAFMSRPPS